ncbi:aldehyde dehydrogenase family protein, partial [Candidatus Pacearchaeota archaeon]|nr:aldehyde dehydrogenase family protein [Candidatus Pacearchaeota archaeon]
NMKRLKNYIEGRWEAHSTDYMPVLNPYTEKPIAEIVDSDKEDVDRAVQAARSAFQDWKATTPGERSHLFLKLADALEHNKERLAKLESENQGKTISMAKSDIDFSIDNIRFFAGACRILTTQEPGIYSNAVLQGKHIPLGESLLKREPLGVIAAITPWNYPIMMACWKLASVAAGNTIILKPSSLTPLTTIELALLAESVGFPKGVINVIHGNGETVGRILALHSGVDCIALTGSTETGKEIMRLASQTLKKIHLELGGKAPFIVFDDADLKKAAKYVVEASIVNSGQDCTAAARVYVQNSIYDLFIKEVRKNAEKVILGDPSKSSTNIGPLISRKQKEKVSYFIQNLAKTEKLVFQSKIPGKGFFYPVTIVKDFEQKGNLCQKEIFGPIIALSSFKTQQEVIDKANDVTYGLASSVWTKDLQRAIEVSNSLDFGEVWINDHLPLVSEMPHGGVKQTGHGRDLSAYSLEEYTYLKHVYIGLT